MVWGIAMEYRTLRYILAVAEEGNISKAAKRLRISQPSLSHCVLKQERELGVALFDRSRKPLRPTYAGECYIRAAKQLLAIRQQLENDMRNIARHRSGRLAIGVTKPRSAYLLPQILPFFLERHPNVEVALAEENIAELETLLLNEEIEIAILLAPVDNEHLTYQHIFEEEIVLCMSPGHPLAAEFRERGPDLPMLRNEPFVLYKSGQRLRNAADLICAKGGFEPNIVLESQLAETILGLVSAGLGCAFVPKSVLACSGIDPKPLGFVLDDPSVTSSFVFAWRKNATLSWMAQEFVALTYEILKRDA